MLKISPAGNKEMNMQRRDFLKYSAALGVASALPLWSRAVFAADRPTLPIPVAAFSLLFSPVKRPLVSITPQRGVITVACLARPSSYARGAP